MTTATTNSDLDRDIGRMEGRLQALEDRLQKVEALLVRIDDRIDDRLAKIESQETERKGGWKALVFVSGVMSSGIAAVVTWVFK